MNNSFAEKVRNARGVLGLTQAELGALIGVSGRAVISYESGASMPHKGRLSKLCQVLGVSEKYLTDDAVTDPAFGLERDYIIADTREKYGQKAAKEIAYLMERSAALFAGGEISQDQKDAFFGALSKAYWQAKDEAGTLYGKKD